MNAVAKVQQTRPAAVRMLIAIGARLDIAALARQCAEPEPVRWYPGYVRNLRSTTSNWRAVLDRSLQEIRNQIEALPTPADAEALKREIADTLAAHSEALVRREIATLIGAYPNARPADPETYVKAMVFDLIDLGFPDAI